MVETKMYPVWFNNPRKYFGSLYRIIYGNISLLQVKLILFYLSGLHLMDVYLKIPVVFFLP